MTTHLSLDDDVAAALAERAAELDVPFEQVAQDILRRSLKEDAAAKPFRVTPLPGGFAPGVDPAGIKQIDADLEDEWILNKGKT